jgi:hypothetical protein
MAYSTTANSFPQSWNGFHLENHSGSLIWQQYEAQQAMFYLQPASIQRQFETQAGQIAAQIVGEVSQIKFELPGQIAVSDPSASGAQLLQIPEREKKQIVGGWWRRVAHGGLIPALLQRFLELERSPDQAVSFCAGLLRHKTALYLVDQVLLPRQLAISPEAGKGVPAKHFPLGQGEAFDEGGNLLANTIQGEELFFARMQAALKALQIASFLAPYITADEACQQKQSWVTGQLIERGQALALHLTVMIIEKIERRVQADDLNRGLSLSLPYFDDQNLEMKTWDFVIIPAGRIGFDRRFVVGAVLEEQTRVTRDNHLSHTTRHDLAMQLGMLERAFSLP